MYVHTTHLSFFPVSPLPLCFPFVLSANSYSLEVVAPASERTINRNRPVVTRMVTETAGMYASVTAPHIDRVVGDGCSLSWLFNVLSKEKEAERVLFEDQDPVRATRFWVGGTGVGVLDIRAWP